MKTKHGLFMRIAHDAARESTCPRASVGAVLVKENRPISIGYNGAVRGSKHCVDDGCWVLPRGKQKSCLRAVHAELNAILNAAYHGASVKDATMYCTHSPCLDCLKACINAGIRTIMYDVTYNDPLALKLYTDIINTEDNDTISVLKLA